MHLFKMQTHKIQDHIIEGLLTTKKNTKFTTQMKHIQSDINEHRA